LLPRRDLAEIKATGKLIALTDFSSSSYFLYKGVPMGFEYELLERFCDHLGVELSIHVVENMDSIVHLLEHNQGDVIAANFTVTNQRRKRLSFTSPVLETRQVLVQRLPENWWTMNSRTFQQSIVRNPSQLLGKKVHVRRMSSFYTRLLNLMDELGGTIDIAFADGVGTEKLMEMVANGEIDYTVADENVAQLNKAFYPNLDVKTPLSFTQHVAWACRKNSPQLLNAFNQWLGDFSRTEEFAVIHMKYFKARTQHRERVMSEYSSLGGNKISPFDQVIKAEAKRLHWDWKLLAALIYQESKFDPRAEAWTGARGLMQLIPETAQRFGADSIFDPEANIHAGVSYLSTIEDYWAQGITDTIQRIPFVLAAYNVGLGHLLDAVRLCVKYGQNPHDWEAVSQYLELKSQPKYYQDEVVRHGYCRGKEPCEYVKQVMALWEHYRNSPV
jgi:membrane-bound lytic murein transglycosylase F